jgi:DNA mismatch repair protein MutH
MILPAPLIVRRRIINKLLKNAVSGENAITLEDARIGTPIIFEQSTLA